ncbi:MAG: protein NO VEIN domain-containing protein [Nitrospiraceae bacterium]
MEKDNLGWDLKAKSGKTLLRIEVKGLSGDAFLVELTPNEFNAFSEMSAGYRLAVVTSALSSPELYVCRYSKEKKSWVIDNRAGRSLQIEVKQSASIKCI